MARPVESTDEGEDAPSTRRLTIRELPNFRDHHWLAFDRIQWDRLQQHRPPARRR